MKKLIFVLLLFISTLLYSQSERDTTLTTRITEVENRLHRFENQNTVTEIENLKEKIDLQQSMSEQTINSISSQLDAAAYNLTLFGILFGIAAIALGFYVTRIERKIVGISEENKELLTKNQKIKEDVEYVNKLIQSDIHKIYIQIKREETDYILDRLVKAPKEMREVGYTLLSRELLAENFPKLRQAYINWDKVDHNFGSDYVKIFTRHFLAQTLKDKILRKDFAYYIGHSIYEGLENEVLKITSDFATVLVDEGVQEFKEEINSFFWGLAVSKYKENHDVYLLLFNNLKSRKNRFDIFNLVESAPVKRPAKIAFGNLLLNQYSNDNPTESESLVFKEIMELTEAQQRDDEEARQNKKNEKK